MRVERWLARAAALCAVFASAFVLVICTVSVAAAEDIRVSLDQAFPVRLLAPAQGVAVGNPAIAGVSVQNDRLIFVTGRSYGSTNLVITGSDNRVLYSGRITVSPDETDVVMVTRGSSTDRLECTPLCRPRPDITGETIQEAQSQMSGRNAAMPH